MNFEFYENFPRVRNIPSIKYEKTHVREKIVYQRICVYTRIIQH